MLMEKMRKQWSCGMGIDSSSGPTESYAGSKVLCEWKRDMVTKGRPDKARIRSNVDEEWTACSISSTQNGEHPQLNARVEASGVKPHEARPGSEGGANKGRSSCSGARKPSVGVGHTGNLPWQSLQATEDARPLYQSASLD